MTISWRRRAPRGRVRAPRAERFELSPDFMTWIAENLLQGVDPAVLVAQLVREGLSRPLASRSVAELAVHPILGAARRSLRQERRLAQVHRLLTLQASLAAHPAGVERRATPPAEEFFDRYLATSTPVVFTDLVTRWPAHGKWTPLYLKEHFGDALLSTTDEREADPLYDARTEAHTRPVKMADFVDRVLSTTASNDFYMVAKNRNIARPELRLLFDDVIFPEGWFQEEQLFGSSALWFGPAGTLTPLHHDSSSILFCQIYGKKRFRLASPLEATLFDGAHHMYSAVDPEVPDDPRVARVTFKDFVLVPGEALFLPAGWWHHVRALDVSISLAVNHFVTPNNYDSWYCPGDVL